MTRKRKEPQEQAREILTKASPAAARLLAQTLTGEEGNLKEKIDCAKEVLNRVYGRSGRPLAPPQDLLVEVKLPEELEEDAQLPADFIQLILKLRLLPSRLPGGLLILQQLELSGVCLHNLGDQHQKIAQSVLLVSVQVAQHRKAQHSAQGCHQLRRQGEKGL